MKGLQDFFPNSAKFWVVAQDTASRWLPSKMVSILSIARTLVVGINSEEKKKDMLYTFKSFILLKKVLNSIELQT